jgi:DNA-binding transcriptional MocR family regulator
MQRTEAWRSLDCVARCAYVELKRRYAGPGSNNGRLPYSVREMAAALNVSKATASRALKRLQERGFIIETKPGTFTYKVRHSTEWRLTECTCDVTGGLPTRSYESWHRS